MTSSKTLYKTRTNSDVYCEVVDLTMIDWWWLFEMFQHTLKIITSHICEQREWKKNYFHYKNRFILWENCCCKRMCVENLRKYFKLLQIFCLPTFFLCKTIKTDILFTDKASSNRILRIFFVYKIFWMGTAVSFSYKLLRTI